MIGEAYDDSGQATVEFALVIPFLFLFSLCVVQVGSVVNDQLALNHAAQVAARAISLADIDQSSAQQVAVTAIERTINLRQIQVDATLDDQFAQIELRFDHDVNLPIIGNFMNDVSLHASATMPRQLATSD